MQDYVLSVPYLVQPTDNTCQSTCLKMFASYLSRRDLISTAAAEQAILDIWKEINTDATRPDKKGRNSYENMRWWLQKSFPHHKFFVKSTKSPDEAIAQIARSIDAGFPVMVSTNHSRTAGHIILVIGYRGFTPAQCSASVSLVCHDPYGKFNPRLGSKDYGGRRYRGGMSLASGSELGPGKAVEYDYQGIRRIRKDKHSSGTYFLISAE